MKNTRDFEKISARQLFRYWPADSLGAHDDHAVPMLSLDEPPQEMFKSFLHLAPWQAELQTLRVSARRGERRGAPRRRVRARRRQQGAQLARAASPRQPASPQEAESQQSAARSSRCPGLSSDFRGRSVADAMKHSHTHTRSPAPKRGTAIMDIGGWLCQ